MRNHHHFAGRGQAARKARALDEIAIEIARHLRGQDATRQELVAKLVRIIEARTNYVFLRMGQNDNQNDNQIDNLAAAFHMMAFERRDGGDQKPSLPANQSRISGTTNARQH